MTTLRPWCDKTSRAREVEGKSPRTVLATTEGRDFEHRRDHAMLRVLLDTGARRAEVANLRVSRTDARITRCIRAVARVDPEARPAGTRGGHTAPKIS